MSRLRGITWSRIAGRKSGEEALVPGQARSIAVTRLKGNPMIDRSTSAATANNVNGPSLIRAPAWLAAPLGRYYLYFADHRGSYIRLATADALTGPWKVYEPGTLHIADSLFPTELPSSHIASPDVHCDPGTKTFRMYFHGPTGSGQRTRIALSHDGITFLAQPEILGAPYFRAFQRDGWWFALDMPGHLYRSRDGLTGFERGPLLFGTGCRHCAVLQRGREFLVFWSRIGDAPERILCSWVDADPDWRRWQVRHTEVVLEPELPWEGGELSLERSVKGMSEEPVRQLRDPAVFEEEGHTYLVYSFAGESGLAIAEMQFGGDGLG